MRTIVLDGATWQTDEDFYSAFLTAVGAPAKHGHNLDALSDSISGRQMNEIELPYTIQIMGFDQMSNAAKRLVRKFRDLVIDLNANRGDPIEIDVPGLPPR